MAIQCREPSNIFSHHHDHLDDLDPLDDLNPRDTMVFFQKE